MNGPTLDTISNDIAWIKSALDDIKKAQEAQIADARARYVSKEEFWVVKTIVYGGAGLVLTAVVGALIALVIKK